jgi:hypothetical protein
MIVNRREFLSAAAAAAAALHLSDGTGAAGEVYVSPTGNDATPGTFELPVRTLPRALAISREHRRRGGIPAAVLLREGVYELGETLRLTAEDAGTRAVPLRIEACAGEQPILSGGTRLALEWEPYRGGILQANVPPGTKTDQLFVNGQRQVLARYPNFDPNARYLNGYAADAISPERARHWAHPEDGFVHALQQSLWGSLHYRIRGRASDGSLDLEGGWQIDRDQPMHHEYRFVEGIFEELDAPGEWFLDPRTHTLYFYPPAGLDMRTADVRIVRLERLIDIGSANAAVTTGIWLRGITFQHTLRTFLQTREQLARSDWRIYRGGAVLIENAEAVSFEDCTFDQPGGNALFVSGHARDMSLRGSYIVGAGASGVCFVGRPSALRNPLLGYNSTLGLKQIDRTAGPRSDSFPSDCLVEECLITRTGCVEKQSAPVEINTAQRITVRRCSLYDVPRAGINIGDGAFGGHLIENCDVFDTVRETSDHGAFNSWGRDRWWHLKDAPEDTLLPGALAALPTLDAILPTVLRRSRWACEHGWDIDLDDGSSNIRIQQNLCLSGGIKLREGFFRVVENNITVRNTLHVHVWPADSGDIVTRNIFFVPYRAIRPRAWGAEVDFNLLHTPGAVPAPAAELASLSGQDAHSLQGDAQFVDASRGDFRLSETSPALRLGFLAFEIESFGVTLPRLRKIARTPDIARLLTLEPETLRNVRRKNRTTWMGATVRNLAGFGEMSEFGAPTETGVVIESVPADSAAGRSGLQPHDLLLQADSANVSDTTALAKFTKAWHSGQRITLHVLRHQVPLNLRLLVF